MSSQTITYQSNMIEQQRELAGLMEQATKRDGIFATAIAPLTLYRYSTTSEPVHTLYQPALCVIAQGSKQVMLAGEVYQYDQLNYLLVSVDLPLVGRITEASVSQPYLCLRLDIDIGQLGELILAADQQNGNQQAANRMDTARGIAVSRIDQSLLDAIVRLLRLLSTPNDIAIITPLIMREIYYRLLIGEQGGHLRQIALAGSQTQRIAKVINWLKQNYSQPLRIDEIARTVHMSSSGLHHNFKAITAMSPLQYQKQLRLQEARRLMLSEDVDAATAGFRVGYESPSQFSREYSRLFGAPPLRDIARLRNNLLTDQR